MKKVLILTIIGILIISCNQKNKSKTESKNSETEIKAEIQNFDWLIGKWKRNNEEEGKETFENWKKISKTEYYGIGFTMQNGDTIKQEKIKIVKSNGKWNLIVKVPEETESITFKMAKIETEKFTCTNDSLDFPKRIEYWKNGDKINALVSGDELEIPFEFERLK